jgi:peptide/nickel transport system substrate-binding protein
VTSRRTFLRETFQIVGGLTLAACAGAPTSGAPPTPGASAPNPAATAPAVSAAAATAPAPATTPAAALTPAPALTPVPATTSAATPANAAPAAGKRGGQLVVADSTDPKSLDPALITDRTGARAQRAIYDPLIDLDENSTLVPGLAESWEISSDARAVTLHLRKGVKFHDGTAFDAQAVKVHFDRHLNLATKSLRTGELVNVDNVDVVDPATVRIDLKEPNPQFLYLLIDWDAFIESPTALQQYGDDYGSHPVGTGPFKLAEYVKDDHVLYERNADYWEPGKPLVDSLKIRSIPVDATRLVELRAGGAHVIVDPPAQDLDRMQQMADVKLTHRLGGRFSYWTWNTSTSPYGKSPEFRQALNWLVDREGIQKAVFFNTGRLNYAPFHAGTPFDDPTYKPFTRDLDKARTLLDRSGVPSPASFSLFVGPASFYGKLAQVIAANFAEVGVNVDIQNLADAALNAERDKGNFHLSVYQGGWSWRADPSLYLRNILHSKSTYTPWIYKDPDVDTLIEQAEAETAIDKRLPLYHQLADRVNEDAALVFAYQEDTFVALSPKVGGWVQRADTKPRFQDLWLES